MERLGHFDGILLSLACILTKQHGFCSGKYLLKTPGNGISETLNFKMPLNASALKTLCLWCEFESHLLFIISLLLKNSLSALQGCKKSTSGSCMCSKMSLLIISFLLNGSINFTLETQVILPLLRSDLYATLMECVNGDLSLSLPSWHTDRFAVGVVAASGGYPGPVKKGCVIQGLNDLTVCVKYLESEHKLNTLRNKFICLLQTEFIDSYLSEG